MPLTATDLNRLFPSRQADMAATGRTPDTAFIPMNCVLTASPAVLDEVFPSWRAIEAVAPLPAATAEVCA